MARITDNESLRAWLDARPPGSKDTRRADAALIANCAVRQAFNVQDPDTAKLLSSMPGQRTVKVTNHGRSGRFSLFGWANNFSENTSETGRPLLAPDEVMLLPEDKELVFVQGCPPILAEKVKYFLERKFRGHWQFWRPGADHDPNQPPTN